MKIKQIWQSFNFRNNKILNAKVEEPQEDEHIASKKYVDDTTTYDTEKSEQFPNGSPKFSWMNFSLNGKSFKEILDDLFFPIVLPVYTEVSFSKVVVTALGEYGNNLFQGRVTNFNIDYVIDRGDRQSTVIPKIRVTTKSPVTVTEYNGTSTANTSNFNFSFNFANIDKIELIKTFDAITPTKTDNYGNPYIPTVFAQPYDATYDVLKNIMENYVLHLPILYRKLTPNENIPAILATIINGDSMSTPMTATLATFTKDRKFFTTADANNHFLIAFPKSILYNYMINAKINETIAVPPAFSNHEVIFGTGEFFAIKTLKYFGVDNDYVFGSTDFGYHEIVKEINLSISKFKQA